MGWVVGLCRMGRGCGGARWRWGLGGLKAWRNLRILEARWGWLRLGEAGFSRAYYPTRIPPYRSFLQLDVRHNEKMKLRKTMLTQMDLIIISFAFGETRFLCEEQRARMTDKRSGNSKL